LAKHERFHAPSDCGGSATDLFRGSGTPLQKKERGFRRTSERSVFSREIVVQTLLSAGSVAPSMVP
jgi:hypothetical protein